MRGKRAKELRRLCNTHPQDDRRYMVLKPKNDSLQWGITVNHADTGRFKYQTMKRLYKKWTRGF